MKGSISNKVLAASKVKGLHLATPEKVLGLWTFNEAEVLVPSAAGFGTAGRASLVMNLVLLLSMLFAGFLVNTASIAPALQWIHYLSVFFYGFESLTTNEISGTQFTFTVGFGSMADVQIGVLPGLSKAVDRLTFAYPV
jgi:hypothetical protein